MHPSLSSFSLLYTSHSFPLASFYPSVLLWSLPASPTLFCSHSSSSLIARRPFLLLFFRFFHRCFALVAPPLSLHMVVCSRPVLPAFPVPPTCFSTAFPLLSRASASAVSCRSIPDPPHPSIHPSTLFALLLFPSLLFFFSRLISAVPLFRPYSLSPCLSFHPSSAGLSLLPFSVSKSLFNSHPPMPPFDLDYTLSIFLPPSSTPIFFIYLPPLEHYWPVFLPFFPLLFSP